MDYYQKNITYFSGQHYQAIIKSCSENNELFDDELFPPNSDSIYLIEEECPLEWKRPREICSDPHLTVDGASSVDVYKGEYGTSSFVAACSILACHKDFWSRVVPDESSQEKQLSVSHDDNYAGIFRFRFWRFGSWCEVVIDDRIPTREGKPFGVQSPHLSEFWCVLLEKAYAKLLGCYEAIHRMDAGSILQDMTGGILQHLQLPVAIQDADAKNKLFQDLLDSRKKRRTMLTSWIMPSEMGEDYTETALGLIKGVVYAVNSVKECKLGTGLLRHFKSDKVRLIKLRNPSGSKEWTGPWSDGSDEWKQISDKEKKRMGLVFESEGEFWMSFDDFCTSFTNITLCRIMNSSRILLEWRESFSHGHWMFDSNPEFNTAGGSLHKCAETFVQNPQFRFDISDESKGQIFVQLQQKESELHKSVEHFPLQSIGIYIAKIEGNRIFKLHQFFEEERTLSSLFATYRTSTINTTLSKGRYVILPTTFDAEVESEFLLRVYSETNISFNNLVHNYPEKTCWAFCVGFPKLVTRVRVVRGGNCQKLEGGVGDVYVIIGCEGQLVRSNTFKKCRDPRLDIAAVFYRKKPEVPIVFTVYHSGLLCDKFIGQGSISATIDDTATAVELPLFGRGNLSGKKFPGTLFVDVFSSDDIYSI